MDRHAHEDGGWYESARLAPSVYFFAFIFVSPQRLETAGGFSSRSVKWVEEDHRCFIQPIPEKDKPLDDKKSWHAFDFESDISGDNHVLNATGWQRLDLGNEKIEDNDYTCEYRRGSEALKDFVRFVIAYKNTTFVAHNGAGYDFILVAEEIFKQAGVRARPLFFFAVFFSLSTFWLR